MIVVADSSPLHYLILIDVIQVLPELFGQVLIPAAVLREIQSPGTPSIVALWISQRPSWLRMEKSSAPPADGRLHQLGEGEREAIALAVSHGPDTLLLMDDGKGRREAERHKLRFMGTLGILDQAASKGLIDLPSTIERLVQTNFYVTPNLLKTLLENDARRKQSAQSPKNR